MEVVNKNVKSKSPTIEYLKSIDINSTNKHEEKEFDNYIVSVVLITTDTTTLNSFTKDYEVYLVVVDKTNEILHGNLLLKEFGSYDKAISYYNELKSKIDNCSENDIKLLAN